MNITFYNFSKRNNSTKQPTGGTVVSCELKSQTTIIAPSIIIKNVPSGLTTAWNYCYIPDFSRYYFITNWTWLNGVWEIACSVDVLASFKTAIGGMTEYILRAASDYNGEISDSMYPATTDFMISAVYASSVFVSNLSDGCYIVGIMSGTSRDSVGAITYYAMTSSEFGSLKSTLFSDTNLEIMGIIDSQGQTIVEEISQEVLKTMYNPFQYIASCMWFPFPKSTISNKTNVSSFKIGWWDYSLSASRLYAQVLEFAETLSITSHPQASRGKYLNYAPFTKRTLIGRFGTVAVDTQYFISSDNIDVAYFVDLITGQCRTTIGRKYQSSGSTHIDRIAERFFLLAVPIQIAQVGTDYLGTLSQAVGTIGATLKSGIGGAVEGFASGGVVGAVAGSLGGVVSTVIPGIYNTLNAAMPIVETSGCNGSFIAANTRTELLEHFYYVVDDDNTQKGRPLCEYRQINTLSGFIMVDSPDVSLNCFEPEKQMVSSYMSNGFFYE